MSEPTSIIGRQASRIMALLFTLTLLAGTASCRGRVAMQIRPVALRNPSIIGHTDSARERSALHPAVIHAIMRLPQLPFAYGGHLGPLTDHEVLDTRPLVPQLNALLAAEGSAFVIGTGGYVLLLVSKPAKGVMACWAPGAQGGDFKYMWVDLQHVEGAFTSDAALTMAEVTERLVVVGDAQ